MITVGEKINATRKSIKRAIAERDTEAIQRQIVAQSEAGASYIDLNAGSGTGDREREAEDLCWLVDVALEHTDKKLSLDAADPEVIARAAEHLGGRRPWLFNSIKGDPQSLEAGLPRVAEAGVPFIALAMSGSGLPKTVDDRLRVAEQIVEAADARGIPHADIFLDPLVLPIATDIAAMPVVLDSLRALKERFPECRTIVGLSNCSHGLPLRKLINAGFLTAALTHGLDAAILDPTSQRTREALLLGELLAGRDRHCRRYTRAVRKGELA